MGSNKETIMNLAVLSARGAIAPEAPALSSDYDLVRRAIRFMTERWRQQPSLAAVAEHVGVAPMVLHRRFTERAGLTPKAFLQAVTLDRARPLLETEASILEASYELGLSGPGRLHDLFVTHEAITPGTFKARGEGLEIGWAFHPSPFGHALVMATERGLAGLAFADEGEEEAVLGDMTRRWPRARFVEDRAGTAPYVGRIFGPRGTEQALRLVLIGSDFEIRVWEALLKVPFGATTSYSDIAAQLEQPKAVRAVGGAVGRNPISFVVPCHRVLGKGGSLTGYHWGLTRKRSILGWEAGVLGATGSEAASR
jgi:AraC family transcriptional regulator of adaptative response/methylated-DNA-[protein]-cysteine methyltransferase